MRRISRGTLILGLLPCLAWAQSAERPPRGQGYGFVGAGTRAMTPVAGFGGEAYVFNGLGLGAELGGAALTGDPNYKLGVGSANLSYHFFPKKMRDNAAPFVTGGYTMLFGHNTHGGRGFFGHKPLATHGFNVGGGVDIFASNHFGLRLDIRYHGHGGRILNYVYPNVQQFSFTALRIGLTFR